MFNFPNNASIESHREEARARILRSFKLDDQPIAQASLVKGISLEEMDAKYPIDQFERYSFDSLQKAKDNFSKGEDFNEQSFEQTVSEMIPVVVQESKLKKLFYVKKKV